MNLYVGNLDYGVKEAQLQAMFSEFGEVTSVKIITDKMSGKSKGFAFVEMPNDDEGREAITNLDQKTIKERQISVSEARPPQEKERRPFRPGGGGSGGNGGGNNRDFRRRF
ncbi:MAG: RNA-binding protein [Saprospiraceae bacterium]|jgi:RNA recognition motif-containing protein|nr:RNA-binding protein [Saprospiraceae bacterium]MBK8296907.1 RNA-binding protein [Saprospiraceae bacterium]